MVKTNETDIPIVVEIKKVARIKNNILEIPRGATLKHKDHLFVGAEAEVLASENDDKIELKYIILKNQLNNKISATK